MSDTIFSFFKSFRVQDVFDILIITSLIYMTLIWFKNTASRLVLVGISLLGGVYILARIFNLYLTTLVLQGFFTILIFALVVIFQEDIRRFFERLATLRNMGKSSRKADGAYEKTVEAISESVAEFTSKKTGSLIVIQGEDPLDRHIKGGYQIKGDISKPLLESIFDVHSHGHDGAVIINNNKIIKFGCHLPLSPSSERFGDFGLRHTAALGLCELTDALCIVVSEERGTIMVAQDGKTTYLKNAVELKTLMERYFEMKIDARSKILTKKRFRQNTMEKAIAVVLALGLWFVFGHQKESVQRDYIVPIEYRKVSQDWEIEESRATQATVTLMGSSQAFSLFDPNSIKASIDLSSIVEGRQTIMLSSDMVNIPSNITVVKFKPDRILIAAHRLYQREVRVFIDTSGHVPAGYDIRKITVEPETLVVLAPFSLTGNRIYITTEPIDLSEITASQVMNMRLVYPNRIRFKNNQAPLVRVTIEVERAQAGGELRGNKGAGSKH